MRECNESCAWFNDYWKRCGVISELTGIGLMLKDIRDHVRGELVVRDRRE